MQTYYNLDEIPKQLQGGALTIGNFDGVHRGHLTLIEEVKIRARTIDGPGIVMTFSPHPGRILAPKKHPPLLTGDNKKARLIEAAGVEHIIFVPFDEQLANYEPERFVREIIVDKLHPKQVIVGYDFCFGHNRRGNFSTLRRMSKEYGFDVDVVGAYSDQGSIISSSLIRKTIASGEVEAASRYLGRYYSIEGEVVGGKKVGRQLGYPTANIDTPNELVPADGVYAALARVDSNIVKAAASIGGRPTFGPGATVIEAFLLDFEGDLYDTNIELGFISRLRDQIAFSGPQELTEQISRDVSKTRQILDAIPPDKIFF